MSSVDMPVQNVAFAQGLRTMGSDVLRSSGRKDIDRSEMYLVNPTRALFSHRGSFHAILPRTSACIVLVKRSSSYCSWRFGALPPIAQQAPCNQLKYYILASTGSCYTFRLASERKFWGLEGEAVCGFAHDQILTCEGGRRTGK